MDEFLAQLTAEHDIGFQSYWRQNSDYDCLALHYAESFLITLPLSQYNLNNTERDLPYLI